MKNQYLHLSRKIVVTVNDVDFTGRIKPVAVMGYFQDVATEHADLLGVGYDKMLEQNYIWIMSRLSFEVHRTIRLGEELTVITYPKIPKLAEAGRDYYIYDRDGNTAISGSSRWCVLSADTHMIRRCAPLLSFPESEYNPVEAMGAPCPKIIMPEGEEYATPIAFTVQPSELDRNLHMNNSRYGDAILNTCGADILKTHEIAQFDINFLSELFVNDHYEVSNCRCGEAYFLEAKRIGSDQAAFRARVTYRPHQ